MKRILIIEDDKEINNLITSFLAEQGYSMINAYNGLEGVTLAKEQHPDIILLDIMLPYQSGDEVLKSLRLLCDTPVIIISAKSMIQTKIDLLRLGADDYITKPFDLNELLARVETILKRFIGANKSKEDNLLAYGTIQINTFTKEVLVNGNPIVVTA